MRPGHHVDLGLGRRPPPSAAGSGASPGSAETTTGSSRNGAPVGDRSRTSRRTRRRSGAARVARRGRTPRRPRRRWRRRCRARPRSRRAARTARAGRRGSRRRAPSPASGGARCPSPRRPRRPDARAPAGGPSTGRSRSARRRASAPSGMTSAVVSRGDGLGVIGLPSWNLADRRDAQARGGAAHRRFPVVSSTSSASRDDVSECSERALQQRPERLSARNDASRVQPSGRRVGATPAGSPSFALSQRAGRTQAPARTPAGGARGSRAGVHAVAEQIAERAPLDPRRSRDPDGN